MLDFQLLPFPILQSERLVLNQVSLADVNEIFIVRSDPKILEFLDRAPAASLTEIEEHIKEMDQVLVDNTGIKWGIRIKGNDQLIGDIGIWRMDKKNHRVEIGYSLMPEYHRTGIMSEAMKMVIEYTFNTLKFHSIEANTHPDNKASQGLLMKNGFVQEAYFTESYYFDGRYTDSAIYCLVNKS